MAWHVIGTRRYFYHSERVNGKPVRSYIGKGKAGEVAAEIVDLRRLELEINARELKAAEDRLQQAEAPLNKHEDLALLLKRAETGDRSVLPKLHEVLDADQQIWKDYGDLAQHSEAALGMLAAGENLLLAESLKRTLREMKEKLGGPSPSPLERLLVECVTATWLQVNYYLSP